MVWVDQEHNPWFYGTPNCLEGNFDKLCYTTFHLGGVAEEHTSLNTMLDKMNAGNHCLVGEFKACRSSVIFMVLDGTLSLKNRGSKKERLEYKLKEVRKTIVSSYEEAGRRQITDFDITTLATWKEDNPDKDPKKEGHTTGWEYHKNALVEIVYERVQGKGKCRMQMETGKFAKK